MFSSSGESRAGRLVDVSRRWGGALATDAFFRGLGELGQLLPPLAPRFHGLEMIADVPYGSRSRLQRLDVIRPTGAKSLPVVLYIHGGGFRFMSKRTHRPFGVLFARRGHVVVNVNYRLAPRDKFPAAVEDVFAAFLWMLDNISRYGGDPSRVIIAGESAGANLSLALTVACCTERPEPYARRVFERNVVPSGVIAACGILQVSEPDRFWGEQPVSWFVRDRIAEVERAYLGGVDPDMPGGLELADPLCILERNASLARPLPPVFAPVGTADPVRADTPRLARAIEAAGGQCLERHYPGEPHAFHGMLWRRGARTCWRDIGEFVNLALDRHDPEA